MNDKSNLKIISGSSNPVLAKSIADYLHMDLTAVARKPFADGEIWVQIEENIRGADTYIIQSTNAPVNDNLMELLIMIDAAKRASAGRITAVMPFFGYARADRKDKPRIAITAKLVANLLQTAGANQVITMDLHAPQIAGFFDIPVDNLFSSPVLLEYYKDRPNLFVLSPDVGGLKRASAFADVLHLPMGFASKKRKSEDEVENSFIVGDIKGRDVLMLDDMTESLGTLMVAAKAAIDKGAKSVSAAVTHGVFNYSGFNRLWNEAQGLFKELVVTDTVAVPDVFIMRTGLYPSYDPTYPAYVKKLSVRNLFAEAIVRTFRGESVAELFEIKGF